MQGFQAFAGILLLTLGLEADCASCYRWRMNRHHRKLCLRTFLAFALPIAGVMLMLTADG